MPAGRPTSYRPEYLEQAKKLCLIGATDEQLADFFGIALSTLNKWKLDFPEFSEALKASKTELDNKVVQSLFRRAMGYYCPEDKVLSKDGKKTDVVRITKHYPPDTVAMIFWLKNRQPDAWRDKRDLEVSHKDANRLRDDELEDIALKGKDKTQSQPTQH